MPDISLRTLDPVRPGPFTQYLLPPALRSARLHPEDHALVGAVLGRLACGAACVSFSGSHALLTSLFIDPAARRRGGARRLLLEVSQLAAARGIHQLEVSYTLKDEDLEAMDALLQSLGGKPVLYGLTYTMDAAQFHHNPITAAAFRPDFQPDGHIVPFSRLDPDQQQLLEEEPPDYLVPSACRDRMDPALSLVWMEEARPMAFVLGGGDGELGFALLAAWRREDAPARSFIALLRAQLNLCYYRNGGDFLYHVSAVTEQAATLVERITRGTYTALEVHSVLLPLPFVEDKERCP